MPRGKSDRSIVRATISIGDGVERRGRELAESAGLRWKANTRCKVIE